MRHVYSEVLVELGEKHPHLVMLEADLMMAIGTKIFKDRFPERLFNVGVAEANMIGIAAGLSTVGKLPFVNTFVPFASRRCYDQFFVSANYSQQHVKVQGFDPGITAAFNGGTHMSFEDIALMRAIPRITITEPADEIALRAVLPLIAEREGCAYTRIQRPQAEPVYDASQRFELGKGIMLRDGSDLTIIATGPICVSESVKAADMLADEGLSVAVADMFTVKPLDEDLIEECARNTRAILSCENHQVKNGMGSGVAEVLAERYPVLLHRHGIYDEFGEVGTIPYLQERYGLTAQRIAVEAKKTIKDKEKFL